MNSRLLGLVAVVGSAYLMVIAIIDPRFSDGALNYSEMKSWEYPIFIALLLSCITLWLRGLRVARSKGASTLVLALIIWPYGAYLELRETA